MSMEKFSDEELMLLEQLTYMYIIDSDDEGKTLGEVLNSYTDDELAVRMADSELGKKMGMAVCDYIKENENMSNLVITDVYEENLDKAYDKLFFEHKTDSKEYENLPDSYKTTVSLLLEYGILDESDSGKSIGEIYNDFNEGKYDEKIEKYNVDPSIVAEFGTLSDEYAHDFVFLGTERKGMTRLAICLEENIENPIEAMVLFKGTTSDEWPDNVEGLFETDTERQIEALEYVKDLGYEYYTLVGHSKGGNKTEYVGLLYDKVVRCVCMDAQGFSLEFYEKYPEQVLNRANLIKNYSIETDFVHPLLLAVPGAQQIYCEGFRIAADSTRTHHEPDAFFELDKNGNLVCENGNPVIVTERDGKPIEEDPSIKLIRDFTCFITYAAPLEERKKMGEFLATAAGMYMGGNSAGTFESIGFFASNIEEALLVLAYLFKYMEINNLNYIDIETLIKTLGAEQFLIDYGIDKIFRGKTEIRNFKTIIGALGEELVLQSFWLNYAKIQTIVTPNKELYNKIPYLNNAKGNPYSTIGDILIVDTNKLRSYADRLASLDKRIKLVQKQIDSLPPTMMQFPSRINVQAADIRITNNNNVSNCKKYLEDTAIAFEKIEREVQGMF